MNGKKVILNESSFKLLMEQYQMVANLYPLARLIYEKIRRTNTFDSVENGTKREKPLANLSSYNPDFIISSNEVARYVEEGCEESIAVYVLFDQDELNQMAYFESGDPGILWINLAVYVGQRKDTIVDKIAHELTHLADKFEYNPYNNEYAISRTQEPGNTHEMTIVARISEYFMPKELNARANEIYSFFYNNIDNLFPIINRELGDSGEANADDIIRQMFLKTWHTSLLGEMINCIDAVRDDSFEKSPDYRTSIVKLLSYDARNGNGLFFDPNYISDVTSKEGFKTAKEHIYNTLKEKFNQFCAFVYWEFKELLKYVVNTYYINNQQENNG